MSYKTSASCIRKAKARRDTIINIYRELFSNKLPHQKQYWTLAGPCYDKDGYIGTNSEIRQLSESGLISAGQYHGIDNSEEIIKKNMKASPVSNFYYGDFVAQLQIAAESGNFNPGIIHADYTRLKETVVTDTSNIVYLVEKTKISEVMIVMNFPWNNPYAGSFKGKITPQDAIKLLQENQRFNISWNNSWSIYPKCYTYAGTGKNSKTTMTTFVLFKNRNIINP